MSIFKQKISRLLCRVPLVFGVFALFNLFSGSAFAGDIVDAYNLAPFVPIVLETMMTIATSLYDFFVGKGDGIIYILLYVFLAFYLFLYLFKMYLPKDWLTFIGFSEGGDMWENKADAWTIADNVLKPCLRVIVACVVLLQIKPVYVTEWLVNPFLEFGSIYSESILQNVSKTSSAATEIPKCPESITTAKWLSKSSCDFLIKPVFIISHENNQVIKYGWKFLKTGIRGLMTLIPHGGEDLLNIITGILLLVAFISSNLFMALLIIQGIFDFCLSLIMYPFNVLVWVAKKSDKWVDVLPAFKQIIDSLKKLVITMIACAFILSINIAIVRALFNWSSSVFVVAAGGVSTTNVPSVTNTAMNFGQHSLLWLSSILTFFLMQNIFKMTRERLDLYTKDTKHDLYDNVTKDIKTMWGKINSIPSKLETLFNLKEKAEGKK
ncbi:MAG: hypothetical protein IKZ49_00750 [Alphaproteobacteria bacterium]|nr:hypothetical protein [Alphaproteobacteria bacterium]